jgi:hypothetical protein
VLSNPTVRGITCCLRWGNVFHTRDTWHMMTFTYSANVHSSSRKRIDVALRSQEENEKHEDGKAMLEAHNTIELC